MANNVKEVLMEALTMKVGFHEDAIASNLYVLGLMITVPFKGE
jgi:hypothetical protein